MKTAIQGTQGSYHHQAAIEFFKTEHLELQEYGNFSELAKSVFQEESEFGIMAIENSIAGTLLPNYSLISRYDLKIVGEIFLPIHHQLMALPNVDWSEITEVRSHPMALLQCNRFLEENNHLKIVESSDTATTAQVIANKGLRHVAAIASRLSAELYGLQIIKSDIQTIYKNSTRFFVLKKTLDAPESFDKISLKFTTSHEKGALVRVLQEISDLHLNMKKIQSVPIVDDPWQYAFHVDIELEQSEQFDELIERLHPHTHSLEILGKYKNAIDPILNPEAYPPILEILN